MKTKDRGDCRAAGPRLAALTVGLCTIFTRSHQPCAQTIQYAFTNFARFCSGAGSVGGTGSTARFSYPCGIAVDHEGTLYFADTGSQTLRKVTLTGVVKTWAGAEPKYASLNHSRRLFAPNGALGNEELLLKARSSITTVAMRSKTL
jgi:hypothetical protein